MSKPLPLSPKHGVNPSLLICFFCGEDTGKIVLLGKLPSDAEAPRKIVLDKTPCSKCQEKFSSGITFFESTSSSFNDTTGRYFILSEEATRKLVLPPSLEKILTRREALIDPETFSKIVSILSS